MTPSASELRECLVNLIRAASTLPKIALFPKERMVLAGNAFREAPLIVEAVCRALEEHGDLFAEVPLDPKEMRAGQERARLFLSLHATLDRLARRAHDAYLIEQSRVTSQALGAVRHGRSRLQSPYRTRAQQRIEDALRTAEHLLCERGQPGRGRRGRGLRRLPSVPRFTTNEFMARLHAAPRAAEENHAAKNHEETPRPPLIGSAARPSQAHSSLHHFKEGAHPMPSRPAPAAPASTRDIASADEIKTTRANVAEASSRFHLSRLTAEERGQLGGTLSASEMAASQAAARFLAERPETGAQAGVPPHRFRRALEAEHALARLGRAAGQLEAASIIGEMMLGARLTEHNDRIFLFVESDEVSAEERDALRMFLASADLYHERQLRLARARKERAALRREKQEAELEDARAESERLRRRERLQSGALTEKLHEGAGLPHPGAASAGPLPKEGAGPPGLRCPAQARRTR